MLLYFIKEKRFSNQKSGGLTGFQRGVDGKEKGAIIA